VIDVPLPRPRDQLATKEHPEFLRLRRELYQYLGTTDAGPPMMRWLPWRALAFPALLLGALELVVAHGGAPAATHWRAPSAALQALAKRCATALCCGATAFTLGSAALGLALACLGGRGAGHAAGPVAARGVHGFSEHRSAAPIPSVALIPLAMLVLALACAWR
jgi:sulfonate transport system permease protein